MIKPKELKFKLNNKKDKLIKFYKEEKNNQKLKKKINLHKLVKKNKEEMSLWNQLEIVSLIAESKLVIRGFPADLHIHDQSNTHPLWTTMMKELYPLFRKTDRRVNLINSVNKNPKNCLLSSKSRENI